MGVYGCVCVSVVRVHQGENNYGQLGNGYANSSVVWSPPVVSSVVGIANVSCGWTHACAVNRSGAVLCWGDESDGRLGEC